MPVKQLAIDRNALFMHVPVMLFDAAFVFVASIVADLFGFVREGVVAVGIIFGSLTLQVRPVLAGLFLRAHFCDHESKSSQCDEILNGCANRKCLRELLAMTTHLRSRRRFHPLMPPNHIHCHRRIPLRCPCRMAVFGWQMASVTLNKLSQSSARSPKNAESFNHNVPHRPRPPRTHRCRRDPLRCPTQGPRMSSRRSRRIPSDRR